MAGRYYLAKPKKKKRNPTQPKKEKPKSTSSGSRHGRRANPKTVSKGQAQSAKIMKAHTAYQEAVTKRKEKQAQSNMRALQKQTGIKYKNNQEIKPAVYTADPEAYKEYRTSAAVIDKRADKTVYDAENKAGKGVTLKEYYSAPEHQKEAQKQMEQDEKFINEHPFWAGVGNAHTKLVDRGVEDLKDIYSNVKRKDGGKGIDTKKYDKSKAAKVGNLLGLASQYIAPSGIASKIVGRSAVKATTKATTKALSKSVKKKLTKDSVKQFGKRRAVDVATASPIDVAHAYKDANGDKSDFVKNVAFYAALNAGGGAAFEGIGKGIGKATKSIKAKSALRKATKASKATSQAVKKSLEALENRAKEQDDFLSGLRSKMGVDGKVKEPAVYKQVERNIGKREITITDKDGKVLAKGVPRNKNDTQIMLRSALNQAGGAKNVRVSSKDLGSPMSRFRKDTDKLAEAPKSRPPEVAEPKPTTDNLQTGGATVDAPTVKKTTVKTPNRKSSTVREEKVKELLPSNHKRTGNTKEISKAIDDDIGNILAKRKAGDIQGAEKLENDLARKLAEEDKYIYDDMPREANEYDRLKNYLSSHTFYPPEGMTVKEARELFGSRVPGAKGVIKFIKRGGKLDKPGKNRHLDGIAGEIDDLFPGALNLSDTHTTQGMFEKIGEYLANGYNKDRSLVGELSGKELDEFVDMKRADIQSAIRDIENDIKAKEPVVAKAEEPKPKAEAPAEPKIAPSSEVEKTPLKDAIKAHRKGEMSDVDYAEVLNRNMYESGEIKQAEYEANLRRIREARENKVGTKPQPQPKVEVVKPEPKPTPAKANTGEPAVLAEPTGPGDIPPWATDTPKPSPAEIEADIIGRNVKSDATPSKTARAKLVDQMAALEDISREAQKIPATAQKGKDLMGAINGIRQAATRARFHLYNKVRTVAGEDFGKSATEITTPIRKLSKKMKKKEGKDLWNDFQEYVYNKHNISRAKKNKGVFGNARTAIDSEKVIAEIEAKYANNPEVLKMIKDGQEDVVKYFKKLQDIREAEGLVGPEDRTVLDEMYENYVQTKRNLQQGKQMNMGDLANQSNTAGTSGTHAAKKSNEKLLSIEEQMKIATEETYHRVAVNNVIRKLADLQGGGGDDLIKDGISLDEMLSRSLFAEAAPNGKYYMKYYDGGELQRVSCSRDVYNALTELNNMGLNPANWGKLAERFFKGAEISNSIFKKLVTEWNPFFALFRNPWKDMGDVLLYSRDLKSFVAHIPQTVKHMATRDDYWQLWKQSGGTSSSLFESTKSLKVSKNPIGIMNQMFEQFPRMTEFSSMIDKQLKAAGHKPGELRYLTPEMIDNASQAGADVTVNFGRSGTWTRELNKYGVPFLNPGVQGVSKGVRTLITERQGARAWVALAIKAASFGFAPGIVSELYFADDPDYQALNARDKANNLLFKRKDGTFWKFPMGRVLADLGAPARALASAILGTNGYEWGDIVDLWKNNSAPANPFEDNLLAPIKRTLNNETWYGGMIESEADEKNKGNQYIYDANTTELAKTIAKSKVGEISGLTPKKIDTLFRSYGGVLAEGLMPLDTARTKGAPPTVGLNNLFRKTFTLDPTYSNRLQAQFYETKTDVDKAAYKGTKEQKRLKKEYSAMQTRLTQIGDVIDDVQDLDIGYEKKNQMLDDLAERRNSMIIEFNKNKKNPKGTASSDIEAVKEIVGAKHALKAYTSDETYKKAKKYGDFDKFYEGYRAIKEITPKGTPSGTSNAVALASAGADDKLFSTYEISDDVRDNAKSYLKNGGSVEEYKASAKILKDAEIPANSKKEAAIELAKNNAPDRLYKAYGIKGADMQSARAINISASKFTKIKDSADTDGSTRLSKAEITTALNKTDLSTNQKAAAYNMLASWPNASNNNPYGQPSSKSKGDYKLKGVEAKAKVAKATTGETIDKSSAKTKNAAKAALTATGGDLKKAYDLMIKAQNSKHPDRILYAPYNDKDYIPKETLQVKMNPDREAFVNYVASLPARLAKRMIDAYDKAEKKPVEDNTKFADDSGSGGGRGGRGGRRRGGRRGGRGGKGGSSAGGSVETPKDLKPTGYNGNDWSPIKVKTNAGWTDAQIRKVYNEFISHGLTPQQAIARISSLWHTRFG